MKATRMHRSTDILLIRILEPYGPVEDRVFIKSKAFLYEARFDDKI